MVEARKWILRSDGIRQRYHTTTRSLIKDGYRYDSTVRAWAHPKVWVRTPEGLFPRSELLEVELVKGNFEVVFYTDYKEHGRHASERYELRMTVEAVDEEDALDKALEKLSHVPDVYRDFLDGLGVTQNRGVSRIERGEAYEGVRYFRFGSRDKPPKEPKQEWTE